MNVFTRLKGIFSADIAAPLIDYDDVDTIVVYEADALEHWLFGPDTSCLVGKVAGGVLTPQDTDHSFTANSVIIKTTMAHGLATAIADADVQTMVIVAKRIDNIGTGKGQILIGALRLSADPTGSAIYTGADGISYANSRTNTQISTAYPAGLDVGEYAFYAFSESVGAEPRRLDYLLGGAAAGAVTEATAKGVAPRNIVVGNGYYNSVVFGGGDLEVAEAILYDRALSAAELAALYVRRKALLASRGITVF